jgi:uncharacterized protein (TIGR02147 family)
MLTENRPPKTSPRIGVSFPQPGIDIFEYDDYHLFLRDWVEWRRKRRASFSYQELANRAGLRSRSSLRLVAVEGREIQSATAARLGGAMGLDEAELDYFLALVVYNNAKDPMEKQLLLRRVSDRKRPSGHGRISAEHFSLFRSWYILPVWEIATSDLFDGDLASLGDHIDPVISSEEAREAIEVLLGMDLIERTGDRFRKKKSVLLTQDRVKSATIREYQRQTLELVPRALERFTPEARFIGTMTIGLDGEGWGRLNALIEEFKQKLVQISSSIATVDRVYQMNMQAFPLTKIGGSFGMETRPVLQEVPTPKVPVEEVGASQSPFRSGNGITFAGSRKSEDVHARSRVEKLCGIAGTGNTKH